MSDINKEIIEACAKNDSLGKFKVIELKRYLANHRQNVSGVKSELIERVKGTFKLGLGDLSSQKIQDKEEFEQRQWDKFCTPQGETIPHPDCLNNWKNTFETIPDFDEKEIYNYLVLKMRSKRQLKSRGFLEDGHVHNVEVSDVDENSSHCYVRAKVIPSFPTADKKKSPDYSPWLMLSKVTGCVNSADCGCAAGDGESCNHIGALLYTVADICQKRRDGTLSSTSQKCKWSNPRKRKLSPKKSQDVSFVKYRFEKSLRKQEESDSVKKNHTQMEKGCTVNVDRFKERLLADSLNVGWLQNFEIPLPEEPKLPSMHSVPFKYTDSVDLKSEQCQKVFRGYFGRVTNNVTPEKCQLIETLTRGQNSTKWMDARKERITSSVFGQVVKRKDSTEPDGLLKSMLYTDFQNSNTKYGKTHEKPARKMYSKFMNSNGHKGLLVKECGFIVSKDSPFLGTSPDGLVYCTHCESQLGLVEIKCPAAMKWRMNSPNECASDKDFFCEISDGKVSLKKNHNYYFQVQGQMGITGRKWCDFVVWTCVGMTVERITFDEELWFQMVQKLEQFYVTAYIAELFSRRVQRGIPLFTAK